MCIHPGDIFLGEVHRFIKAKRVSEDDDENSAINIILLHQFGGYAKMLIFKLIRKRPHSSQIHLQLDFRQLQTDLRGVSKNNTCNEE